MPSRCRKTFASSSRSTESPLTTDKKRMTVHSTMTCSTTMMKWRTLIKTCYSMTMIKRCRCSRRWRIKKLLSCKSNMPKRVPHQQLKQQKALSQITLVRIWVRLSPNRGELLIKTNSKSSHQQRWAQLHLSHQSWIANNQSTVLLWAKTNITAKKLLNSWWILQLL